MVSDAAPATVERRRAVILVGNPANPYSRAIRIGRTLAGANPGTENPKPRAIRIGRTLAADGYDVEIAAPLAEGTAEREEDGPLVIRRYRPSGTFARLAATYRAPAPRTAPAAGPRPSFPRQYGA